MVKLQAASPQPQFNISYAHAPQLFGVEGDFMLTDYEEGLNCQVHSNPETEVSKLFYSFEQTIEPMQMSLSGVPTI